MRAPYGMSGSRRADSRIHVNPSSHSPMRAFAHPANALAVTCEGSSAGVSARNRSTASDAPRTLFFFSSNARSSSFTIA